MGTRNVFRIVSMLMVCLGAEAQAQRILVLPGAGSDTATVSVFAADPLAALGTVAGEPGILRGFMNPEATRYFFVTYSEIVVMGVDGTRVQAPLGTGQPVTAAAMDPDGSTLVVGAGGTSGGRVLLVNVSANTASVTATLTTATAPLDVAVSLDGATAYVLTASGIIPIDLAKHTAGTQVALSGLTPVDGAVPGVTVGPNGLVYVNAGNALYELNPATLAATGSIALPGFPGKPSFSKDAASAVVVNQWPYSQSTPACAWTLNLTTHAISGTVSSRIPFTEAFYINPYLIYLISPTQNYVYSVSASAPGSPVAVRTGVVSAAASGEPTGPKYVFSSASGKVTRFDFTGATLSISEAALGTPPGKTVYTEPARTGEAVSVIQFNASQKLAPQTASVPLVVRALDSSGNPLEGVRVAWKAASGVALSSSMAATNARGYATATATAPSATGEYSVSASFPASPSLTNLAFKLAVTDSSGVEAAAGLSMVNGNGQVLPAGRGSDPLVVLATDTEGNPVSEATVTFTVTGGEGTLGAAEDFPNCTATNATTVTCPTDSHGLAGVTYTAQTVSGDQFYVANTVEASLAATAATVQSSVTFIETSVPTHAANGTLLSIPQFKLSPDSYSTLTGKAGATLTAAIQANVTMTIGAPKPVPNAGIYVRTKPSYIPNAAQPAACAGEGGAALSNADGVASCNLVLGRTPGTYRIYVITGGVLAIPYNLTIEDGSAAAIIVLTTGEGQSAVVGQSINIAGTVKDENGAAMAGTAVSWTVLSGNATFTSKDSSTNAASQARATVKIAGAGPIRIQLTSGIVSNVFHLTGTTTPAVLTKISGDHQNAATDSDFAKPLVVKVTDSDGSALPGVAVEFTATGGATLAAASVRAGADGVASVAVKAGSTAGTIEVTARAGGQTQRFSLTVGESGLVLDATSFLNGASFAPNYISLGGIATIKAAGLTSGLGIPAGTCLVKSARAGAPTGSLPTRIAGVEIQFGSQLAPIFAICNNEDGSEQVNVQVPFELSPGTGTAIVRYGAGTDAVREVASSVYIRNAAPGIFENFSDGATLSAVALRPDGTVISASNPAHAGETIRVYATGLGPVLPAASSNVPGTGQKSSFTPTVKLGGRQLAIVDGTYAPGELGIFTVSFRIPSGQAAGAAVPLVVGVLKSDNTTAVSEISHIAIE